MLGTDRTTFFKEIPAVLITSNENRFYYSGFSGSAGWLLITPYFSKLFTDFRYITQASLETSFEVIDTKRRGLEKLAEAVKQSGCTELLFEDDTLSYKEFKSFQNALDIELVAGSDIINAPRAKKDIFEIQKVQEAQRLADEAFLHVIKYIRVGMTEIEIAFMLEDFMRQNGALKPSFNSIVASGKRSAMPHGAASSKTVLKGEFITMDYGCVLDGYCSDMTRTVCIGPPKPEQEEVYNIVLAAHKKALSTVCDNVAAKDVDYAARSLIEDAGFAEFFGHGLGHGVGLEVHELPIASPTSKDILEENMLITIEPGIYIPEQFGVRIEDLVVVTKDGYQNLNASTKELIIL